MSEFLKESRYALVVWLGLVLIGIGISLTYAQEVDHGDITANEDEIAHEVTVEWLPGGSILTLTNESYWETIQYREDIEIGLRSDGVVVWREHEED